MDKEIQDNIITLKINDTTLEMIDEKAQLLNMSRSAFIKKCIRLYFYNENLFITI